MGNNIGGASNKAAKVMKINGEYFKVKLPAKVIDIIKDYPDHILLDSEEFMRYKLRAKPLELDDELKTKKIYLLFELPKFPDYKSNNNGGNKSPLRRVRSGVQETTTPPRELMMMMRRTVSDLSIMTKSTAVGSTTDSEDGGSEGSPVVGPTRVKMRLPKAQVKRIMEESSDEGEVGERILQLFATKNDGGEVVEVVGGCDGDGGGRGEVRNNVMVVVKEEEEDDEVVNRHCFSVHRMCSPSASYQRKYGKLIS